jgi:hypothetical protein
MKKGLYCKYKLLLHPSVLNKDLDLRVHFSLHNTISNLIFSNGMIGVVSQNNLIFLNLLGGNQILLQCLNNNRILDAVHDSVNNYLYLIDSSGYLLIYNSKLSISKPTNNECDIIYKVKLVNSEVKQGRMEQTRSILYVILDNRFLGVIDISLLDKSGLVVNRFYINSKLLHDDFKLDYSLLALSPGRDSMLAMKVSDYDVITTRLIHHDTNNVKVEKTLLAHIEENILYVYGVVVLVVIYVFFMMRKPAGGAADPQLKPEGGKDDEPLTAEDHRLLEEMFKKIRDVKNPGGGVEEPIDEEEGDYEEEDDDIDIDDKKER